MTNYEIVFFYDLQSSGCADESEEQAQSTDNIFFFNCKMKDHQMLFKTIDLSEIKEIQRRRFLGQKTAIEIFLTNNKQVLLNFENMDLRNEFAKKVLRQRKNRCKNLKYYTSLDPKWILKMKNLTDDWVHWKISNFDYIM